MIRRKGPLRKEKRRLPAKRAGPFAAPITKENVLPFIERALKTPNPAKILLRRGLNKSELFEKYGIGTKALRGMGMTIPALVEIGCTGRMLNVAQVPAKELIEAHVPPQILAEAIGPAWILKSIGISSTELAKHGYTKKELTKLGFE